MKKGFKKRYVIIPSIIVAVLLAGSLTVYFTLFNGKKGKDKPDEDISNLFDDKEALMARYNELTPGDNIQEKFRPYELALIAEEITFNTDNYYSYCNGEITAVLGIKQYITSRFIKNGDNCFEENISSGAVKVAHRYYENLTETSHYKGKCLSKTKGEFNQENKESYPISEFKHKWGRTIKEHHSIIVSGKTVDAESVEEVNNEYYVKLSLNSDLASTLYGRWMLSTSNIDGMPLFHKIEVEYHFNQEMKMTQFNSYCVYDAKQIVYAKNTKEQIEEKYVYETKTIPQIGEDADF